MSDSWGSDVPVSMVRPLPDGLASLVPMGGFTMTVAGLFPDLTTTDHERISRPTWAPYDLQAPVVDPGVPTSQ